MAVAAENIQTIFRLPNMVVENYGGAEYAYIPLGEYVVAARGVCGGRPTIKYTRLDARHVISMLNMGDSHQQIAERHKIPIAAIDEAVNLSSLYDYEESYA